MSDLSAGWLLLKYAAQTERLGWAGLLWARDWGRLGKTWYPKVEGKGRRGSLPHKPPCRIGDLFFLFMSNIIMIYWLSILMAIWLTLLDDLCYRLNWSLTWPWEVIEKSQMELEVGMWSWRHDQTYRLTLGVLNSQWNVTVESEWGNTLNRRVCVCLDTTMLLHHSETFTKILTKTTPQV